MATIVRRSKALSVSPLKASQTIGAALAFLGIERAVPLMHGAQGCTAFGKVFFVRHFREPIPLQTTAMDQISSVMGADENVVEGLRVLCQKQNPSLIGVPTTGLAETQGADIRLAIQQFRDRFPEYAGVRVVPVNTPDFSGCLESGYAAAVEATIDTLLPDDDKPLSPSTRRKGRINVLAGSLLTVGDIEVVKEWIEAFGLTPVVLPDLADSLDGHVSDEEFTPLTDGGTSPLQIETLAEADATIVIGRSLYAAADVLRKKTGVPDYRIDHLLGLEACDAFLFALHRISGVDVPRHFERQRAQLQDAMMDTHFAIGQTRCAIALDPDLLLAYSQFLREMGAEVVAAVAPDASPALESVSASEIQIGDLEDLERAARSHGAELVVGSSHAVETAHRLGVPILRAGFPLFEWIGGYAAVRVGYRGARQLLFDLANLLTQERHHLIQPYHSKLSQKTDRASSPGEMAKVH